MIGLVLALAGFVTYDVGDVTPVLALDSLGAFDAERTRRLCRLLRQQNRLPGCNSSSGVTVDTAFDTILFEPAVSELILCCNPIH